MRETERERERERGEGERLDCDRDIARPCMSWGSWCCHAHGRCKAGTCTGQCTAGPGVEIAFLAEVNEVRIIGPTGV